MLYTISAKKDPAIMFIIEFGTSDTFVGTFESRLHAEAYLRKEGFCLFPATKTNPEYWGGATTLARICPLVAPCNAS